MFAYRNAVCLPFPTARGLLAGTWSIIAWTAAALMLSAAGLAGLETCAQAGEATAEPTYDGRTMDEWRRLAVSDLSHETRAQAMEAFEAFARAGRRDEAIAAIKSALEQPQARTAIRAGYNALVRLAPAADPLLLEGLRSEQAETRRIVVKELGSYLPSREGDERVVPEEVLCALIRATEDADPSVRGEACYALGRLVSRAGPEKLADRIVAALIKALEDETPIDRSISGYVPTSVQSEACRAVGRCGAKAEAAVPKLLDLAQREPKPEEQKARFPQLLSAAQRAAIDALGNIGPAAEAAVPVLEGLEEKPRYRSQVSRALSRIQGKVRFPRFPLPQRPAAADRSDD
jgi:HEAT repeat protein